MTDKRRFILAHPEARTRAMACVGAAPAGYVVTVQEPSRSLDQNAAQWPVLEAFSEQLKWPVNGEMVNLTPEEYKDLLTAAFKGERVRLAMGMNGGVVMIGLRTSKMGKKEFSEYLDFIHAEAVHRGVVVYEEAA